MHKICSSIDNPFLWIGSNLLLFLTLQASRETLSMLQSYKPCIQTDYRSLFCFNARFWTWILHIRIARHMLCIILDFRIDCHCVQCHELHPMLGCGPLVLVPIWFFCHWQSNFSIVTKMCCCSCIAAESVFLDIHKHSLSHAAKAWKCSPTFVCLLNWSICTCIESTTDCHQNCRRPDIQSNASN